jgi:hypothetical protein
MSSPSSICVNSPPPLSPVKFLIKYSNNFIYIDVVSVPYPTVFIHHKVEEDSKSEEAISMCHGVNWCAIKMLPVLILRSNPLQYSCLQLERVTVVSLYLSHRSCSHVMRCLIVPELEGKLYYACCMQRITGNISY